MYELKRPFWYVAPTRARAPAGAPRKWTTRNREKSFLRANLLHFGGRKLGQWYFGLLGRFISLENAFLHPPLQILAPQTGLDTPFWSWDRFWPKSAVPQKKSQKFTQMRHFFEDVWAKMPILVCGSHARARALPVTVNFFHGFWKPWNFFTVFENRENFSRFWKCSNFAPGFFLGCMG